ncbi:MAG: ABC transporter ATP-binding protein [Pseudomonadota bacterium]
MIRIEHLTKFYARQHKAALDDVTLNIPEGSVFGLLGPNGAGKTTLISILVGLQKKSSGEVWFDGKPLEQSLSTLRSVTGFVPQDLAFYPMLSVTENLAFYAAAFGIKKALSAQHIEYVIDATRLHEHVSKTAENLSGGLKRRLNLAIGLLNRPRILFLDEPTVGIDPQSRNFILNTIAEINRSEGTTVIYTSHYMQEVQQLCDTIAIIDDGRIRLYGELQQLLNDASQSRLEFRLQHKADQGLSTMLRDKYGADSTDGHAFSIADANLSRVLEELPALLQQQGNSMLGVRSGYQNLEDLYMLHVNDGSGA